MIRSRSVSARPTVAAISLLSLAVACLAPASARAQAPGSLDTDFNPTFQRLTVYAVALDHQQRILVGGDNLTFTRLKPDGSGDKTFKFSEFGKNRIVYGLAIDTYDRVYVVGGFDRENDNRTSVNITRFDADGARVNRGFDAGSGANNSIVAVLLQPVGINPDENKVIVGGLFNKFRGERRNRLARLNASGTLDSGFDSGLEFNNDVFALALQTDGLNGSANGQILVGGAFDKVNGASHGKLVRVNFNGTLDDSFAPDVDGDIFAIAVQPDGKIVIGGTFETVNGHAVSNLARLNPDGSFDDSFSAGVSQDENQGAPPVSVNTLSLQGDEKLIIGGNFLKVNDERRRYLARLNPDGSVDSGFDPGDGVVNRVEAVALQYDNRLVVGEVLSKKIGDSYPNVVRRVYGDYTPPPLPPGPLGALDTLTISGGRGVVEGEQDGYFSVSREGLYYGDEMPFAYRLVTGGGAPHPVEGVDFEPLSGRGVIPAGSRKVKIPVISTGSALSESREKLTLKLTGLGFYKINGTGKASINFSNAPTK